MWCCGVCSVTDILGQIQHVCASLTPRTDTLGTKVNKGHFTKKWGAWSSMGSMWEMVAWATGAISGKPKGAESISQKVARFSGVSGNSWKISCGMSSTSLAGSICPKCGGCAISKGRPHALICRGTTGAQGTTGVWGVQEQGVFLGFCLSAKAHRHAMGRQRGHLTGHCNTIRG